MFAVLVLAPQILDRLSGQDGNARTLYRGEFAADRTPIYFKFTCHTNSSLFDENILIILRLNLEKRLRMLADRTKRRSVFGDVNMSAVDAFPNDDSVSLKNFTLLESIDKSSVAFFVNLLDLGDPLE